MDMASKDSDLHFSYREKIMGTLDKWTDKQMDLDTTWAWLFKNNDVIS